jgi:hypothetical protein
MVGAPAAVPGGTELFDVFYRDTKNRVMRAFVGENGWTATSMGGVVITDPVAVSTAPGRFDVVALGVDYTPYHFSWDGTTVQIEQVSATRGLGQPALLGAPGRLDIFVRGFDRAVHHVRKTGAGVVEERVGGVASDFPTAAAIAAGAGTIRRVFVHGQDNRIWAASSLDDGPWTWELLAPAGMTDRFAGSPTASIDGDTVVVHVRASTGTLGVFRRIPATGWTYANVGGAIADSPTSLGATSYAHGRDGTLQRFDGTSWHAEGGRFD